MYVVALIALALLILILISVAVVYKSIPIIELKRRARSGQKVAKSLYKVAVYSYSAQFVLWFLASLASVGFFVLIAKRSPLWVALTGSLVLIWVAYIWIPRSSINVVSQYLAQILSKPLGWILQYLHTPITKLRHIFKSEPYSPHTRLYEREDIVRLLEQQAKQNDNRINEFEIETLKQVISFGDKKVIDVMVPRRQVKAVALEETLGPVTLSELHKIGHVYYPVYSSKPGNIVGTISLSSVRESKLTRTVEEVMSPVLFYAHEDQYLGELMQIIVSSHQEIFIVINNDQEYTGIVTAKDIIIALVGKTVTLSLDEYSDPEKVANRFKTEEPEIEEVEPKEVEEVLEEGQTEVIE